MSREVWALVRIAVIDMTSIRWIADFRDLAYPLRPGRSIGRWAAVVINPVIVGISH